MKAPILQGMGIYTTGKALLLLPFPFGRGAGGEGFIIWAMIKEIKRFALTLNPSPEGRGTCVDAYAYAGRRRLILVTQMLSGYPCHCNRNG